MILRNRTQHPVNLYIDEEHIEQIDPEEPAIRLEASSRADGSLLRAGRQFPLVRESNSERTDLPDPEPGVLLIVGQLVCLAYPERDDLVYPAQLKRDEKGNVIGCRAFARVDAQDSHSG